jgi:hypothetical protein
MSRSSERPSYPGIQGIQRRPVPYSAFREDTSYSPAPNYDLEDPYQDDITSAGYPKRTEVPLNMSDATLQKEPHQYPYVSDFSLERPYGGAATPVDYPLKLEGYNTISVDPNHNGPNGVRIQSGWRRALLTWLLAILALASFLFTVLFAYNATRGAQADTHLIFNSPGRTILVLQILTNISTTLFGELLVASCEMVPLLHFGI